MSNTFAGICYTVSAVSKSKQDISGNVLIKSSTMKAAGLELISMCVTTKIDARECSTMLRSNRIQI